MTKPSKKSKKNQPAPLIVVEAATTNAQASNASNTDPLSFDPSTLDFGEIAVSAEGGGSESERVLTPEIVPSEDLAVAAPLIALPLEIETSATVTPEIATLPEASASDASVSEAQPEAVKVEAPGADPLFEYVAPGEASAINAEPIQSTEAAPSRTILAGSTDYTEARHLAVQLTDAAQCAEALEGTTTFVNGAIALVGDKSTEGALQTTGRVRSAQTLMADAGLGFTVEKRPMFSVRIVDNAPRYTEIKGHRAITRTDTEEVLSVQGPDYSVFQNSVIAELADAIVAADGELKFGNAINMNGGRKFALQLEKAAKTGKVERMATITLFSSHDGTLALTAGFSNTIIVCKNTFRHALDEARAGLSIRHSKNGADRLKQAIDVIKAAQAFDAAWDNAMLHLMGAKMNDLEFSAFAYKLIPGEGTRAIGMREDLAKAYRTAPGHAEGTRWGAMQAATYYTSHDRGSRMTEGREVAEMRFESNYIGSGARFVQSAYDTVSDDKALEGAVVAYGRRALSA